VPTRGERRPSRSDLRERQCGDAGRSGANEAGEGAVRLSVCSAAEMRWCSAADRHKEDQGGVGEASYQTAGAVVSVAGGGQGGEGGGRGERRAVGWLALGGWDWDWERRVREREREAQAVKGQGAGAGRYTEAQCSQGRGTIGDSQSIIRAGPPVSLHTVAV
jgi:hypothetical protein